MANKYVDFISDEYLLECIQKLHQSYTKAKADITTKKFYKNKIDIFKQTFDEHFNNTTTEEIIENEIIRQVDKSYGGAIGAFHENVLGGIEGFEVGKQSGYDVKKNDNTLFADIKNKHNTMNSPAMEGLYIKLQKFADEHKSANCYWVQILAKDSFIANWEGDINGKEYRHSRVYKISGDKFYEMLTKDPRALYKLYKSLPDAISDYFKTQTGGSSEIVSSALEEISNLAKSNSKPISDQIAKDNYPYYSGFDEL
ncbi:unnamed protein product [Ectocarpus sp. 12 AP-2014]